MKFRAIIDPESAVVPTVGPADDHVPFSLYGQPSGDIEMSVGGAVLSTIRRKQLAPSAVAWDFLSIAMSAILVDAASLRAHSPDGWTRELTLEIPVTDPTRWSANAPALQAALSFLTTDVWTLRFSRGAPHFQPAKHPVVPENDCVALLSGGLDSLIGAIDLVSDGRRPYLVSQTVRGDRRAQEEFAAKVEVSEHIQLNHNARTGQAVDEASQRARSLVFIAYGVLVASTLAATAEGRTIDLFVNENGFIAINPAMTPMRVGSLSTRPAHPLYFALLQQVFDAMDIRVRLSNPYKFQTKGEMLANCANQELLRQLARRSTSCGRYQRHGYTHCGRCIPCQVRRAAFLRWPQPDLTGYVFENLGAENEHCAGFDDVRSLAVARLVIAEEGLARWLGTALSSVPTDDKALTRDMLSRAMDELGALHDRYGVG